MSIEALKPRNLYIHFPFCRRKCSYCALHSRAGVSQAERDGYAKALVERARGEYATAYFGGGSPALCDLRPLMEAVSAAEFTVELHPLDVSDGLLRTLKAGGVNRISMGVQSLNDEVLRAMGRGYVVEQAKRAFAAIRRYFENAGIDLIVGYGNDAVEKWGVEKLGEWGLRHCSVYSLMLEENTLLKRQVERGEVKLDDDERVMDELAMVAGELEKFGLRRYEISNYAQIGYECRHNMAVWRGEDYLGLGEGAHGRIGRKRTPTGEILTEEEDRKERTIFRLRTREGLDATAFPEWIESLERFCQEGLLVRSGKTFRLTARGSEVCDAILAELV